MDLEALKFKEAKAIGNMLILKNEKINKNIIPIYKPQLSLLHDNWFSPLYEKIGNSPGEN